MASFYYIYVNWMDFNSLLGDYSVKVNSIHDCLFRFNCTWRWNLKDIVFQILHMKPNQINKTWIVYFQNYEMCQQTFKMHIWMRQMNSNGTRIALVNSECVCVCLFVFVCFYKSGKLRISSTKPATSVSLFTCSERKACCNSCS